MPIINLENNLTEKLFIMNKTVCPGHVKSKWPWPLTLILSLPEQMFQMANLLMMENNCAKFILKAIQVVGVIVRTKIWPSSVTLTLSLSKRMFQMAHMPMMENNCVKSFWNPSTIVEVMVQTTSDRGSNAYTLNYCSNNYVSLTTSGLDKNQIWTRPDNKISNYKMVSTTYTNVSVNHISPLHSI